MYNAADWALFTFLIIDYVGSICTWNNVRMYVFVCFRMYKCTYLHLYLRM